MAYNISDIVEFIQFYFFKKNSCHGFLKLKGREMLCPVNLTGTCAADLWGKRIHVEPNPAIATDPADPGMAKGLHNQQNGVTGKMTAAHWLRYHGCAPAEFIRRAETGELPPLEWKRGIYLEWFSANGRVLIELIDPMIEVWVSGENLSEDDDNETWELLSEPLGKPSADDASIISPDTSFASQAREAFPFGESLERVRRENPIWKDVPPDHADDDAPAAENLESYLDDLSRQADAGAGLNNPFPYDPNDPFIKELDYMEEVMEGKHDSDDLMATALPERPDLDSLSDDEAEAQLKVTLAALALYGIVFHCCDHYNARDLLRLIHDEYAQESRVHPGMLGTGWTTHFDTAESCETCMAEFEAEWERDGMKDPPF